MLRKLLVFAMSVTAVLAVNAPAANASTTPPSLPSAVTMAYTVGLPKGSLKQNSGSFGMKIDGKQASWGISFSPTKPETINLKRISSVTIPNASTPTGQKAWNFYNSRDFPKDAKVMTRQSDLVIMLYTLSGVRVAYIAHKSGDVAAVVTCEARTGQMTDEKLINCADRAQAGTLVFAGY